MHKIAAISMCCSLIINNAVKAVEKKELIDSLYQSVSGFNIPICESDYITKEGGAPTYGEITYESAQKIIEELSLSPHDVFYDLGSGIGKMVMQVYLESPVKKSGGIELSQTRCQRAQEAREKLKKDFPADYKEERILSFENSNINNADMHDATVVYMCSLCFSDDLMKQITDKLSTLKHLKRVISLRQLPEGKNFFLYKTLQLPMTWSTNTSVYIYGKKYQQQ